MKSTNSKILVDQIIESIQDKKGQKIIVADLSAIEDSITNYFVICEGRTPNQVSSLVENIKDEIKQKTGEDPLSIDGLKNAEWVAMDYADVVVHVFLPEARTHYSLETLWADAHLKTVPDID